MMTLTLTQRVWATGIHGVTGQQTEEGWLDVGTLVRRVEATGAVHPLDGMPCYRFDASTDGGRSWFLQECCGEPKVARAYQTIRNCNFASREDDRGRHVHEALVAADRGCDDCDLIGALDDLESTLAGHAEDDSEESMRLCREAEEAVEAAFIAVGAAFENVD